MVKARTATIIIILALFQVSCKTTADSRQNAVALTTVNRFQKAEDGGGAATCDARFHSDDDLIVALPSGWYAGGKRCHKAIRITSVDTGRSVEAQVVDKCECGVHGCKNKMVHSSRAVWKKLGLHTDVGKVHITCSDA